MLYKITNASTGKKKEVSNVSKLTKGECVGVYSNECSENNMKIFTDDIVRMQLMTYSL